MTVLGVRNKLSVVHRILLPLLWLAAVQSIKILLVQERLVLPPGWLQLVFDLKVYRVIPIPIVNRRISHMNFELVPKETKLVTLFYLAWWCTVANWGELPSDTS